MPPSEGQAALDALDAVLADKPKRAGHDFSEATRRLARFRDALIAEHRASGDGEAPRIRSDLAKVNAAISAVLAGHFPLGAIPWDVIERARAELDSVVRELQSRSRSRANANG